MTENEQKVKEVEAVLDGKPLMGFTRICYSNQEA